MYNSVTVVPCPIKNSQHIMFSFRMMGITENMLLSSLPVTE